MALSKKDMEKIEELVITTGEKLIAAGRKKGRDMKKQTIKRLYAYPQLKENIKRYRLDIEDIRQETFGKSKSIVVFQTNSGSRESLTLEERRAAKIRILEMKIERDEEEVKEIEAALNKIRDDENFEIIEMLYFEHKTQEEIAKKTNYVQSQISRISGRLIDVMNAYLYGADALS